MMGNLKERIGRFGSVQRAASILAIAILAVSPAIVPMTGSHLDGVGPAITEAVFGGAVYAQEPPCEPPSPCIVAAEAEFQDCLDRNPWYQKPFCYAARIVDIIACGMEVLTG